MTLNQWQQHLHEHFARLRDSRALGKEQRVLYALEHGLKNAELADLNSEIKAFIRNSTPSDRHWLAWIVYSAEIGYDFSGDEYWTTFADKTPGWVESGADRAWLRTAFWKFHGDYSGAQPTGRWANHFSIIAWPITHAILPRDLQRQLAQVLYEIRYLFDAELLGSPELLGKQIEAHSWNASSRFCDLAGEHLLVGQIATALLLDEKEREAALILPSTLERIASDLDDNRRSREWLKDAQRRAISVRLRGLHRGISYSFDDEDDLKQQEPETENRRAIVELGVEPDLVVRRLDAQTWDVRLQLPDLSRLLTRFPQFKDVLANERCNVAGVQGRTLARGFLLYGTQEVSLTHWPEPGEILLKFENSNHQLDFLLTAECLLRPGPRWLFKILAGGSAVEIRTHTIQPGNSYIVLTRTSSGLAVPQLQCTAVKTRCAGVSAVRIDVPDTLSPIYSEQLADLGIQAGSGLRLRPVGIPAAKWDDQGTAEWLSSDSPLIAITSDFELSGLALNLLGPCPAKLELSGNELPSPMLVDLGPLESGRYKLHVITEKRRSSSPQLVHGTLSLTVREPRTWKQDLPKSTPLSVFVSPAKPGMEELWDGHATIEIFGPQGRKAESELRFFKDVAAQQLLHTKQLSAVDLPCTNQAWQEALDAARYDKRAQNAYDESSACVLELKCEELGEFKLSCERQATPLRWILKEENHGYSLRLLQLDDQLPVSGARYPFEYPDRYTAIPGDFSVAFRVPPEGGLYSATTAGFRSAVVVPPHIQSFAQLHLQSQLAQRQRTEQDVSRILSVLELWSTARVSGDPISRSRKDQIVSSLTEQLISLLCGDVWVKLEKGRFGTPSLADLRNAISSSIRHAGIGRSLTEKQDEFKQLGITEICGRLSALAKSYLDLPAFSVARDHGVARQDWVVEFAFRLVNGPEHVRGWGDQDFVAGLNYVLRNSVLLRMARFAGLLRTSPPGLATLCQNAGR